MKFGKIFFLNQVYVHILWTGVGPYFIIDEEKLHVLYIIINVIGIRTGF